MPRIGKNLVCISALLMVLFVFPPAFARPDKYTKADRDFAQEMLKNVAADVQKHYYDANLHGVDWDAKVQEAKKNIEAADSMNNAVSEIAALLDSLNDSHTRFYPPPRITRHDYGFDMEMIGDRCFVTRLHSDSDAGKKGLKVGDEILAVNDHPVSRNTLWRIYYIYETLRPQPGLRLTLADETGHARQLEVMAKITTSTVTKYFLHQGINQRVRDLDNSHHYLRARYFEKGDELLVVKFPEFAFSTEEAENVLGKMRKHKCVVLDLRSNPGGFVDTLDRLLGGMFQYDQKLYDRVDRDSTKTVTASGRHHDAFTGRLVVLIDSQSASASEIFARVIQLEHRGFIVGDRSSGMVMEARFYYHETFVDSQVAYGANITGADLHMADGKSLEHVGIQPDIVLMPTAQDLASNRDPVLAKAAAMVGVKLTPEEAGAAIPYEEPESE